MTGLNKCTTVAVSPPSPLQRFTSKQDVIRHYNMHKKRDNSLQHGFMRFSPLDDCSVYYHGCHLNGKSTHYHCMQVQYTDSHLLLHLRTYPQKKPKHIQYTSIQKHTHKQKYISKYSQTYSTNNPQVTNAVKKMWNIMFKINA